MLARLLRSSYVYVVINTVVSLLAFGRNLLFMNSLGLAEVGQIALMQTIVMLVGFAQGGLISGTFILWAGGDVVLNRRMADVLFVGKAVLGVLLICGLAIVGPDVLAPIVNPETLLIGLAAGLATLASTWMNNALVADQKLRQSNLLNVVAVLMSLGLAILTLETNSLMLALGAIALQPLLVALGAMLLDTLARPRIVRPDPDTLRRMLAIGVRPFLGSLSLLLVYQIERWSIAGTMGPEALGRYFIVILYMTFFLLVPTALMNVNFPRASRALAAGETDSFRQIIRRHMAELAIYAGLALLIKLALLSLVLDTFLPNFTGTESLVYLATAGRRHGGAHGHAGAGTGDAGAVFGAGHAPCADWRPAVAGQLLSGAGGGLGHRLHADRCSAGAPPFGHGGGRLPAVATPHRLGQT